MLGILLNRPLPLLTFSILLLVPIGAQNVFATTVIDANDIPAPSQTVDFSQFTGDFSGICPGTFFLDFCFTGGPMQIGGLVGEDITWSGSTGSEVIGNGEYGLETNGEWNANRDGYIGSNPPPSTMRIDFNDNPVCAVGGFVNYVPNTGDVILIAYDSSNAILESFDLLADAPISTPNTFNDGAFRGFVRDTNDIAAIEFTDAFDVLDDLKFSRNCGLVVGGEIIPIETTSLILAGAQSFSWMISVVLSGMGIGFFVVSRKSENS